jgi:hypothetical protein
MEIEYSDSIVFFRWSGFDEGDEVSGGGSAELHDDGTVEIDLSFDIGGRCDPQGAPRVNCSTAC